MLTRFLSAGDGRNPSTTPKTSASAVELNAGDALILCKHMISNRKINENQYHSASQQKFKPCTGVVHAL
jgi:hypothetical protein